MALPPTSEQPLVSIFTTVKNGAKTIRRCLESVQRLDYPHVEHVIQDAASTDGTLEIIRDFASTHPNVIFVSEPDSCMEEGFFRGLKRCRGALIGTCLADETVEPGAAAWAVAALAKNPGAGAVYGDLKLTDAEGQVTGQFQAPHPFTLEAYLLHEINPPYASTFIRRESFESAGLQTHPWRLGIGEFEVWVRLALKFPVAYVPGVVASYSVHGAQLSARKPVLLKMLQLRVEYLKELCGEPSLAPRLASSKNKFIAGLHFFIAGVLRDSGHLAEAVETLERGLSFGGTAEMLNRTLLGFFETGERRRMEGDYEAAMRVWRPLEKLGVKLPHFDELKKEIALLESARRERPLPIVDRRRSDFSPKVSVIVVSHNYGHFLERAFADLARQTYQNFEVILIDDGSDEASLGEAKRLTEMQAEALSVRLEILSDVGPSRARSHGISLARGDYYVPLDADDRMAPTFLEQTVAVLEQYPKVGYAYTDQCYFGDKTERVAVPEFDLGLLARSNYVGYCSLVRKEAFVAIGGYDAENWGYYEDWDLWLRLGEAGWHGKRVPYALFLYNYHFGSSLSYFAKRLNAKYRAFVMSRHPRLYPDATIDAARRELTDMYAQWHALPPMRSVDLIERTLAANPGNSHLLYFLAEAHRKRGQTDAARQAVQELLRLHPGDELGQNLLRTMTPADTAVSASAPARVYSRRLVALMSAYNEGDVIYHVIGDLIANGLEVYLIDNNSSDNTREEAAKWLGKGLIKIERFPDEAGYAERCNREYVWKEILTRKEEIAATLDASWFLHVDADEFRESPWPGLTLADAIRKADALGYNALNFELFNFRPTDDGFVDGTDVRAHLTLCEIGEWFNALQIKAWKNTGVRVQLAANGGHSVMFPQRRVFPLNFILRHYPIRGERHGRRKVFQDRLPRFAKEEVAQQWHIQYNEFAKGTAKFLHDPAKLTRYDGFEVRAVLLGRFAEDQLLLNTLSGALRRGLQLVPEDICGWVERRLGLPAPLSVDMGMKLEDTIAKLLPTQARGYQELAVDLSPSMASMLLTLLEAKLVIARHTGDAQYCMMVMLLQKAIRARLGSRLVEPSPTPPAPQVSRPPAPTVAAPLPATVVPAPSFTAQSLAAPAPTLPTLLLPATTGTTDDGFSPSDVSTLVQVLEALRRHPSAPEVVAAAGAWRERWVRITLQRPAKALESWVTSADGAKLWRGALAAGLNRLPLSEEKAKEVRQWQAELSARKAGAEVDLRRAFALMLHQPAHGCAWNVDLAAVPLWGIEFVLEWLLANPEVFVLNGEVEAYHRHFVAVERQLQALTQSAPNQPVTQRATTFFVNRANCIPLYLAADSTKEAMTRRAALTEVVLKSTGARLEAALSRRPTAGRRLKVGFLAHHVGASTEAHVTLSFLGLPAQTFETQLFTLVQRNDAVERAARERAQGFTVLPTELPRQVEVLRAAGLDALVVSTNITAVTNQIFLLAAHRLAPLQLATYVSPMTTGLRSIDGFISGTGADAEGVALQFCEKVYTLEGPPGALDYTPLGDVPPLTVTRESLGVPADVVLFANAAACYKIRPEMLATWARLLAETPGSHLLLFPFNPHWSPEFPQGRFLDRLRQAMEEQGVALDRVHWLGSLTSRQEVMAALAQADLYLDTAPFAGSIAVVDALALGLPVVALPGRTLRSGFSAALLRELGEEGSLAKDEADYLAKAVALANDAQARAQARARVQAAMAKGPRFLNSRRFTEQWSALLEDLILRRKR